MSLIPVGWDAAFACKCGNRPLLRERSDCGPCCKVRVEAMRFAADVLDEEADRAEVVNSMLGGILGDMNGVRHLADWFRSTAAKKEAKP